MEHGTEFNRSFHSMGGTDEVSKGAGTQLIRNDQKP